MNDPVRIVIADDHPMFLYGLGAALAGSTEVTVVGESRDGEALARVVAAERPAVVLTDLEMPGVDGTSAIANIRDTFPDIGVLVLTMHADDAAVLGAIRAGARGYLLKGAGRDEIVRAVLTVAAGDTVFGSDVGRRVTAHLLRGVGMADISLQGASGSGAAPQVFAELTARENQVMSHVAAGRSNYEIARRLYLSEKTVRNNVATILAKLSLRDRAAAVAAARDRGVWDATQ
ncbi:hypothetical protein ART_0073 [Arthrobacter sp. PAMC 25486]|uniref:response regulator transcription factor n=1 Tax=Arthrobacter sp. PAMC 25486 TaxID=1494608 RepID=UPI000536140B|nr:response regulator transcription factor [Arthrobacter sp. PAMC 25486]AIX99671.1 hypothetical protein ART_0073 [Arthrobacter sp. PAMC 25486]